MRCRLQKLTHGIIQFTKLEDPKTPPFWGSTNVKDLSVNLVLSRISPRISPAPCPGRIPTPEIFTPGHYSWPTFQDCSSYDQSMLRKPFVTHPRPSTVLHGLVVFGLPTRLSTAPPEASKTRQAFPSHYLSTERAGSEFAVASRPCRM